MAKHTDDGTNGDAVVDAAARANALDCYFAARLAPRDARRDLIALAAFVGETARIVAAASEPLVAEMRLQWWRDALAPEHIGGEATGNPIADAVRAAIVQHALPVELFSGLLDARSRALDPGLVAGVAALDQYFDETDGAAFRLAARILGIPGSDAADMLLCAAGRAYGRVRLLRAMPLMLDARRHSSHGHLVNDWAALAPAILEGAKSSLQEARRQSHHTPIAAVLPVALVGPYLTALERLGPKIVCERADISPLTRVWRLWWASVRGKI